MSSLLEESDVLRLNKNFYWILRHAFFGQSVGDVLKAIRGGAIVGGFSLSTGIICSMAEIRWCHKNQQHIDNKGRVHLPKGTPEPSNKNLFTEWVDDWLTPKSRCTYDSEALWAVRCAAVHSYGWAKALEKANIDGYLIMRRNPSKHCTKAKDEKGNLLYCLNLEDLVADLIFAMDDCMWQLKPPTESFVQYVRNLIAPKKFDINGNVVIDEELVSLDFFDKRLQENFRLNLTKQEVMEKILELYDWAQS